MDGAEKNAYKMKNGDNRSLPPPYPLRTKSTVQLGIRSGLL